jgi:Lon protease-like protein
VLFPGGRLPLRIFEQRYMDMAKACLRDGTPFGVCLIREGREVMEGNGGPAVPALVGCTARIGEWDMPQLGLLQVVARGERRFRIRDHAVHQGGLLRGSVELLEEADAGIPEAFRNCRRILERVVDDHPELFERPYQFDSALWVTARLAEVLPLPPELKQELLEMALASERLARLSAVLPTAPSAPS